MKEIFRRRFIQSIALTGSTVTRRVECGQRNSIVYHVKGFSCVTCAVGLETVLKREKGILRVAASYSEAIVHINYDPGLINPKSIRALISDMGFNVADEQGS